MSTRGMVEDEAFRTLRDAAMQGKQRVGQVAQRLIDAARSAEAVNRAGQLRMLSQRLVKLHILGVVGIEPESAEALRRASIERLEQNIATLTELLSASTFGELLEAALASWRALKSALAGGARTSSLRKIDETAERLLETAEQLTGVLEAAGPMAKMQVVNLAGRQRMLAQRVAKVGRWLQDLPLMDLPDASLQPRTGELMGLGFKNFDALHLASAELGGAEVFCSCDDRLLAMALRQAALLKVRILSPVELAQEFLP